MANSYFTPAQILSYAEGSIPFAVNDKLKGQLFSPRINPKLPLVIDMETAALRWAFNQGGADYPGIQFIANYVYDLCGIYALKARNAISGGGGIPVVPVTPNPPTDCTGVVYITAADFEEDGVTVFNSKWVDTTLKIFWNNIPKFIKEQVDWVYILAGGFRIIIPGFDAKTINSDCEFYVFAGCFNPGAVINPYQTPINTEITVTGVDTYDLTWTPFLLAAYGSGSFQVYQDDGSGIYQPTANLPIPDNVDNPTVYHFTALGNLNTRIIIF